MVDSQDFPFKGIKLHNFDVYPDFENHSVEDVRTILKSTRKLKEMGIFYFKHKYSPAVNSKFHVELDFLEGICEILKADTKFSSCNLIYEPSDIGLPYYILANFEDGTSLYFDGILLRSTEPITNDSFQYNEILGLTGYPPSYSNCIDHFFQTIHKFDSKYPYHGSMGFAYYTINETDWNKLGLIREGPAQGCLFVNDSNIITTTALIFTEFGKDYCIYFGDEPKIHQMLAYDIFIAKELERISSFFSDKIAQLYKFYDETSKEYGGLALKGTKIFEKIKKWNKIKNMTVENLDILDLLENAINYSMNLEKMINKKLAFYNHPNQILFIDDKENHQKVLPNTLSNFYEFKLNEKNEIENLNSQIDPLYKSRWSENYEKINFTKKLADNLYSKLRDIHTSYQTEFSIYAIIIAIITMIITISIQIITTYFN